MLLKYLVVGCRFYLFNIEKNIEFLFNCTIHCFDVEKGAHFFALFVKFLNKLAFRTFLQLHLIYHKSSNKYTVLKIPRKICRIQTLRQT